MLPIRTSNLDRVQKELDAVIADVAARYHDDFDPAIERVWLDGIAAIGADLREWLRRASLDNSGFEALAAISLNALRNKALGW